MLPTSVLSQTQFVDLEASLFPLLGLCPGSPLPLLALLGPSVFPVATLHSASCWITRGSPHLSFRQLLWHVVTIPLACSTFQFIKHFYICLQSIITLQVLQISRKTSFQSRENLGLEKGRAVTKTTQPERSELGVDFKFVTSGPARGFIFFFCFHMCFSFLQHDWASP